MPPSRSKLLPRKSSSPLSGQGLAELPLPDSRDEPAAAVGEMVHGPLGLHATLVITAGLYLVALGASAVLGVSAPVLEGVPLCLGPAAFLSFWSRLSFPRAGRTAQVIEVAFIIVVLGLTLACLSYLCAMADLPLRDPEIIWLDRHLGFDWLQTMRSIDRWPLLLRLLDGAYATFACQLIGTALVLIVARRARELDLFFVTFICASIIAELWSVLVPTLGPMSTLAGSAHFEHLPTLGRATGEIVLMLREGRLKSIDLGAIDGIISFPSLHAAVAVLVPFALRWNRRLFWPILMLNGLMLISSIPSGNHYLTDVLGGVVVAVLAIACARRIQRSADRLIGAPPLPGLAARPGGAGRGHLIACGLIGEPVPPVMISGGPQKKNS